MAEILEERGRAEADQEVVVHEKNGRTAPPAVLGGRLILRRGVRIIGNRQPELGTRAAAGLAEQSQRTLELACQAMDHGQAKAGALADLLGREEGLDCALQRITVHAGTGVRHGQPHIAPFGEVARLCGGRHIEFDGERPAVRHRVTRVHCEVEKRELDLVGVGLRGRQGRRQVDIHLHPGTDRAAQQLIHAAHQLRQVNRPRLERLSPCEGEQPLGQRRAALGTLHGAVDQPVRRRIGRHALAQQLEVAHHRRQQVVEIMCHAASELTDRFQLLQMADLLLGALALGDRGEQLVMGVLQLGGALLHAALELVIHLMQAQLAFTQVLKQHTRLVLASAALHRGARQATQGRGMERPLEEVDVAQRFQPARRDRVALRSAAMVGHEDERQVGPCRLRGDARHQRSKVGVADRIFRQQHEPHVVVDRGNQPRQVAADIALDAGLAQQRLRERRVTPAGRQKQRS